MCNQTVSLIAAELERRGISTVVVQLLRMVTAIVRPPRALCVPFLHGYPLSEPDDPQRQHRVIEAALRLLEDSSLQPPALVDYQPDKEAVAKTPFVDELGRGSGLR
jgi:hypothetical protein